MEAPSLPEGLAGAVAEIRDGLRLVWNHKAKVARAGSFDAWGSVLEKPRYDGRWELWDTTPDGLDYKVMTIEHEGGAYRAPGFWLIEVLNFINPARFGGDISRLTTELIDKPAKAIVEVTDRQFEDLCEMAAKWHVWADTPKQRVVANIN
jgi:hypothetical protein